MLINLRENQRGHDKIQYRRTNNIEHIRHKVKTKKRKLTIPKTKQMSNTDPTKSTCSSRVSSYFRLIKHQQIHQIESLRPVSIMCSTVNLLSISVTLSYFKIHVFIFILFLTRLEKKYSYCIRSGKYT
jgi:hypothetical protein